MLRENINFCFQLCLIELAETADVITLESTQGQTKRNIGAVRLLNPTFQSWR